MLIVANAAQAPRESALFFWRRWLCYLLPALLSLVAVATHAQDSIVASARFWPTACAERSGPGQDVALPNLLNLKALRLPTPVCYEIPVTLAATPDSTWTLTLRRVSRDYAIRLNGQLISARGKAAGPLPTRLGFTDTLVETSPAWWRQGNNVVQIEMMAGIWSRAGLSTLHIGPDKQVRSAFEQQHFFNRDLPQAINLACGLLAILTLLIWYWRPRERALAYFSLLFLLGSLRNWYYYADSPLISATFNHWFFYAAQVWTSALLLLFTATLCHRDGRRLIQQVITVATLLSLLAIAAVDTVWLVRLRTATYPLLIGTIPLSIWWLYRAGRQTNQRLLFGVMAGLLVVFVSTIQDYLVVTNQRGLDGEYWLPYSMPIVLTTFAIYQLRRMVAALGAVEQQADELEAKVSERTLALANAGAKKTRFLAAASHDLRQPMHAISLLVGLLDNRLPQRQFDQVLGQLKDGVRAMESLLKGIMDLSRLDAGGVQPKISSFALGPMLAMVVQSESAHAAERGLTLRARPCPYWVQSDPILLERIVRNLLGNAIRYTRRGGVMVACRRRGTQLLLQVWDTGIGIEPAQQTAIFDEFYQVPGVSRDRAQGLGLGLSIVNQYSQLLGHPLGLVSRPGRGSCFSITLPLAPVNPALPQTAVSETFDLTGHFILLIDDDERIREATSLLLRSWGCHVDTARDLASAREALDRHLRAPDLLLVDFRLDQGLRGPDVITALRSELEEDVPAIIISGDVSIDGFWQADGAAPQVLHKPLHPAELRQALADQLGNASTVKTEPETAGLDDRLSAGGDIEQAQNGTDMAFDRRG
ncbi:hybrid sensor histidine kinase/response regulator [Chitinimonas sp. BJYL2]|uniref:ATP-binding response regulator n=1 Tax=Chitinimonas sp. BJYL2 TaxID=2976696 RepID=UPI0022B393C9|nr:hybrid sensor histidine kinase/response regulator [Chitinimonas sp. BJYL2]